MLEYFEAAGLVMPAVRGPIRLVIYSSEWTLLDYFKWLEHAPELESEHAVKRYDVDMIAMHYVEFEDDAGAVMFKLKWSGRIRVEPFAKGFGESSCVRN